MHGSVIVSGLSHRCSTAPHVSPLSPGRGTSSRRRSIVLAVQAVTLYGPTNMAEVIARVNSIMRCAGCPRPAYFWALVSELIPTEHEMGVGPGIWVRRRGTDGHCHAGTVPDKRWARGGKLGEAGGRGGMEVVVPVGEGTALQPDGAPTIGEGGMPR